MNIQIQTPGLKFKPEFENKIVDKLEWLEKKFPRIDSSIMVLKELKDNRKNNKLAELKINLPGGIIFISERSEDFDSAVKKIFNNLLRKLKREYLTFENYKNRRVKINEYVEGS